MASRFRIVVILAALTSCASACSNPAPAPPIVTPTPGGEEISGTERLGWNQPAGDTAELAEIRYAVYVDGSRVELAGVTCATSATADGYACTSRLPSMAAGAHTLELASFVQEGLTFESARSAPLRVVVSGAAPADARGRIAARSQGAAATPREPAAAPADAVRLLVGGVVDPTDLATLSDGRIFVAERSGRIRIVERGQLIDTAPLFDRTSGALLAIAADPDFERTRFLFAVSIEPTGSAQRSFVLSRFREARNTFADRVVLLDAIVAAPDSRASLRIGPDGRLYAAFSATRSDDPASFNGKLLRLNLDGTTPSDQPRGPIVSASYRSPRGIAWHGASNHLWSADAERVGTRDWPTPPEAIAIAGDALWIASGGGVTRIALDPRTGESAGAGVPVVDPTFDVRVLAAGADRRIYFATASEVWVIGR